MCSSELWPIVGNEGLSVEGAKSRHHRHPLFGDAERASHLAPYRSPQQPLVGDRWLDHPMDGRLEGSEA
jgi:hypothetical protein